MQVRLNKFLAERVGVSRREADELIKRGLVEVNGRPAITGVKIDKNDKVCYNKKIIPFEAEYTYLAMHKPVGYVCSRRAQGGSPTIYNLLPKEYQNLKTVGRLDKDSSGLILLTNDGDFAFKHTHPKFKKEKIYEVELDKPLEPLHQQMISDFGIMLDDGPSKFLVIRKVGATESAMCPKGHKDLARAAWSVPEGHAALSVVPTYIVKLSEGRNRQIRRTFAALGYLVTKLHRTTFGVYELGDLLPGHFQIINKK